MVVDLFGPGREQPVQRGQIGHVVAAGLVDLPGDLHQELVAHRAEGPLDLSPTLRPAWGGVGQLDAQLRAGPQSAFARSLKSDNCGISLQE